MKQTGTLEDYIRAFSSSTSQVKYMDDQRRALLFTSGLVSDLRKKDLKEYPKNLLTAIRLAREADEAVQWTLRRRSAMEGTNRCRRLRTERRVVMISVDKNLVSGGRQRLTNNYSHRVRCFRYGKLAILLEIACSPTQTQTASEIGSANTGGEFSTQVNSRMYGFNSTSSTSLRRGVSRRPSCPYLRDTGASPFFVLSQSWITNTNTPVITSEKVSVDTAGSDTLIETKKNNRFPLWWTSKKQTSHGALWLLTNLQTSTLFLDKTGFMTSTRTVTVTRSCLALFTLHTRYFTFSPVWHCYLFTLFSHVARSPFLYKCSLVPICNFVSYSYLNWKPAQHWCSDCCPVTLVAERMVFRVACFHNRRLYSLADFPNLFERYTWNIFSAQHRRKDCRQFDSNQIFTSQIAPGDSGKHKEVQWRSWKF